jgi:hypothetical protein
MPFRPIVSVLQRRPIGWVAVIALTVVACLLGSAGAVSAGVSGGNFVQIQFDTELTSLDLRGGPFPIPLASDPGNLLGDSIGGLRLRRFPGKRFALVAAGGKPGSSVPGACVCV